MSQADNTYDQNMLQRQLKQFDLQQYTGRIFQRGYKSVQQLAQLPVETLEKVLMEINLAPGHQQKFKDMFQYINDDQILRTPSRQRNTQPENLQSVQQKVTRPVSQLFSLKMQSNAITLHFKVNMPHTILQQLLNKQQIFERVYKEICLKIRATKIRISDVNLNTQTIYFQVLFHKDDYNFERTEQAIKEHFVDQLIILEQEIAFDQLLSFLSLKDYEFESKYKVIVSTDFIIVGMKKNLDEIKLSIKQMEQKQQFEQSCTYYYEVDNKLIFNELILLYEQKQLDLGEYAEIFFTQDKKIIITELKKRLPKIISTIDEKIQDLLSKLVTTSCGFNEKEVNYIIKNFEARISSLENQHQVIILTEQDIQNINQRIYLRQLKKKTLQLKIQSFDENLNKEIQNSLEAELKKVIIRLKLIVPILQNEDRNKFENLINSVSSRVIGQVSSGHLLTIEMLENMEPQIQQFLNEVTSNIIQQTIEQQQYDQLSNTDNTIFTFDILSIRDIEKKRIEMPVVTNKCKPHPKSCLTFIDACNQLAQNNQIVCQCGESVNQLNDLVKDIRQQAYEQFHPIVEQVQIIQGLFFHKYNRKRRYLDYLKKVDLIMPNFLQNLISKYQRSNSISNIIKINYGINTKINFWATCLLDKVKITIPVRIITCKHPECYELTSLLAYKMNENEHLFQCLYPQCQQTLNIETLQTLIGGLVIDGELLKVLNKGFPSQIKFIYEPITKTFSDGMQIMNDVQIDPFILKCYEQMVTADDQKAINYIEFQSQVQNLVAQVMQCEVQVQTHSKQQQQDLDEKIIKFIDPFTNLFLEFPVRCYECKDYNKFIDCRSFAAHYLLSKRKNQKSNNCLLCNFEYNCISNGICRLIYFDQNLISKMVLKKQYKSYSSLLRQDLNHIIFDTLNLKNKIKEQVVLRTCYHFRTQVGFTYSEAIDQWESGKIISCSCCGHQTNNLNDLRKDAVGIAFEEFHPSVEQVQVFNGIFTHQYLSLKRLTDLRQSVYPLSSEYLLIMKKKSIQYNSISSLIRAKQLKTDYQYFSLCLLDQVKIVIPVRIQNCAHSECYELTSLLAYIQDKFEKSYHQNSDQIFQCCHPSCTNILNITSFEVIFKNLYMDNQLLQLLNKCEPSQFKLLYQTQKQQFDLEIINSEEDCFIKQFYQSQLTDQEKEEVNFDQFVKKIKQQVASVIQQGISENYQKILKQEKYKVKVINLIDPYTQLQIEYPVRCIKCKQYDRCVDVRTFVSNHVLAKIRKQYQIQCPLCGWEYKSFFNLTNNIIQCDQNLILRMQVDRSYFQNNEYKYDGRLYLLEWFQRLQKIKREDYLLELQVQKNTTIIEFQDIKCALDSKKKIEVPLILKDCPKNSIIDFDSFYQFIVDINFNLEEKNLVLCQCCFCNSHPIKSIQKSIFYHEALSEVIQEKRKSQYVNETCQYDFEKKIFID